MYFTEIPVVYASNDNSILSELGIIDKSFFKSDNIVTREEAIIAIMRTIGITDEDVRLLNGADLITFVDTKSYSYIGCANLSKIAYGEECIIDYPTYRTIHTRKNIDFFFFPERPITLKESLAFMVRCLECDTIYKDINFAWSKAKEYGLIKDEDELNDDCIISQNAFCMLLKRMLCQKRYKYYDRVDNIFDMKCYVDTESNITYLEFLLQKNK